MLGRMLTIGFAGIFVVAGLFTLKTDAVAEEPKGTIKIAIPAGPGGANDLLGRGIRDVLVNEKLIPNNVTVKNRPGGGGAVAWAAINRHKGDMTQLSTFMPGILTNDLLGASPIKYTDISPIATLVFDNACYAVNPKDSLINSAESLLKVLKNNPEKIRLGFANAAGNHWHIAFAALANAVGTDITKIPYTVFGSGGKARTALLGGHINVSAIGFGVVSKFHEAGKLQCSAMATEKRVGGRGANVPTWKELGVNLTYAPWRGVMGPGNLTASQIKYWEDRFRQLTTKPAWIKLARQKSWTINFLGHKETMALLKSERELYKSTLKKLGLMK